MEIPKDVVDKIDSNYNPNHNRFIYCGPAFAEAFEKAVTEHITKIIVPNEPHKCNGKKGMYNINPKQI